MSIQVSIFEDALTEKSDPSFWKGFSWGEGGVPGLTVTSGMNMVIRDVLERPNLISSKVKVPTI